MSILIWTWSILHALLTCMFFLDPCCAGFLYVRNTDSPTIATVDTATERGRAHKAQLVTHPEAR